ncbi:MAG: hypothetical protein ACXWJD_12675 [Burkholderiaceae bacterium]
MKSFIQNFAAMIIGSLLIAAPFILPTPAHASDSDNTIQDYQGRDKGQHLQIGIVTASACEIAFKSPGRCFLASEAFGLAEQLSALQTNPAKRGREAAYDFLAHSIGAYLGVVVAKNAIVYLSRENKTTTINFSMMVP